MANSNPQFQGFPKEALSFFKNLARNNDREWFQPRKEIFEQQVRGPMVELVEAINAQLTKFAPAHINEPKKAIYRIYRDTRFSSDKTPYKTHIAAIFPRKGQGKHISAGLYVAISAKEVEVAGGLYMPGPEELIAVRSWLAENHKAFLKSAKVPVKLMGELQGTALQRVPKGFSTDHPAADLLKKKQWLYFATLDPKLATTPRLLPAVIERFKTMMPVLDMLNKALEQSAPKKKRALAELME